MTQRIAVIGAGHLGKIHARLIRQVDGAELVAVVDPSESARQTAAEQLDVSVAADVDAILSDFDAAIIASPTPYHAATAAKLLRAGKHLLVEKPLTTGTEDAFELVQLARENRCTLQVGHVERFNPVWTAAQEILQKPKYIEAVRASRFPGRCLDVGVVMDLMIHDIDLVLSLTDAPLRSVHASGISMVSDHEDLAEARLTFECGLVANLKASRVSPTPSRDMQVFSESGFTAIDFGGSLTTLRPNPAILSREFQLSEETDNPMGFSDQLFSEWLPVETPEIVPRNAILDELHDFVICCDTGATPTVSGLAGARAVQTASAVLAAIDARQWTADKTPDSVGPFATPKESIAATSRRIHDQRRAA